jgi:Mg-chelatase subunit ChlD
MNRAARTALALVLVAQAAACGGAPGLSKPSAPESVEGGMQPPGAYPQAGMAPEESAGDATAAPMAENRSPAGMPAAPPPRDEPAEPHVYVAPTAQVKAGEWDDNANYREFQSYIGSQRGMQDVDVRFRRFLVVRDAAGKAVPGCRITVTDGAQHATKLTTTSSGRAILFPVAEGLAGAELQAVTRCQGSEARARFAFEQNDGVVDLKLAAARSLPQRPTIDIAFVLDSTGSMSEEIDAVKQTIRKVASMLPDIDADVRIGLVEFKDVGDEFVTRVYPMSADLGAFSRQVAAIDADGGGDTPEHVNEGLRVAVDQMAWSDTSIAHLAFLVGDAPPHLDYQDGASYVGTMQKAAGRGIQIYTIAASGMDDVGQAVWRQVAQYTGATNMFVLRGGAGPESTGAGDPKSSCGGTQHDYSSGNLAELIGDKVRLTMALVDADPMRIPGLRGDEQAKPCQDRVVIAR